MCVCVVYRSVTALAASASATNDTHGFFLGFSWICIRGFSKNPFVQKLWCEKANLQISTGLPRPALRTLETPEIVTQGEYRLPRAI